MTFSGAGITGTFDVKIKPDFTPQTTYALFWTQLSSGNYACTDRGTLADKYETQVTFYSTEQTEISGHSINEVINILDSNRQSGSPYFTITNCNSTEHIFGADLDYTVPITVTATEISRRTQNTWKGWSFTCKLACVGLPTFVSGNGYLPPLQFVDVGVDADADYNIDKFRSYNNVFFYADHGPDSEKGIFGGTLTFTDAEMTQFRRYLAVQRGSAISIPNIHGINYAWGRRTTAFPLSAKFINFEDLGMCNVLRWKCKITLAQQWVV